MLIHIVRLNKPDQYAETARVQWNAWGQDESETIPAHLLIAAQHHGGLVLGAYDGERMVGVLFGFTSLDREKAYHYSHITGVVKDYQTRGIGFKLKMAQRRRVLQQGQELVKWTYDPLQAANAFFNVEKLGAICRTYKRNLYGQLNDSLNRGRVTDRFEAEWWLKSRRVRDRVHGRTKRTTLDGILRQGASLANETVKTESGWRRPVQARTGLTTQRILVEIPESIVKVRGSSPRAANDWTKNSRRVFEHYFQRGYAAVGVVVEKGVGERRVFYTLQPFLHQ